MLLTWVLKFSLLSKVTPRLFGVWEIEISAPALLTELRWFRLEIPAEVPSTITSDFVGLRASPLLWNKSWTASEHHVSIWVLASELFFCNEMYSWISSAYWWCVTPNDEMILAMGDTYKVKSISPSTEPWGTPCLHWIVGERARPTLTYCDLSVR